MKEITRLTPEQRETVASYGARTTWPAGFVIYERGASADGVFVVLRGQVVLRNQLGGGRSFVPWVASAGETFGAEGLERGARYATAARAEEESETLHLSGARFSALLREQPAHALVLIRQLASERTCLLEKFSQHATLTVEQRLITSLIRMAQSRDGAGSRGDNHVLSRRLLGELVGATRESISLVLSRLTAEGMVEREGNGLVISDLARLKSRLADTSRRVEFEVFDDRRAEGRAAG